MNRFNLYMGFFAIGALATTIGCGQTQESPPVSTNELEAESRQPSAKSDTTLNDAATTPVEDPSLQKARQLKQQAVLGFGQLSKSAMPDESWFDYRGTSSPVHFLRQEEIGRLLEWETSPLGTDSKQDPITFMFAGGMGYVNQPKTGGFGLEVNGQEILRFDVAAESHEWKSDDDKVKLFFFSTWTGEIGPDASGLFFLTLSREHVTEGKPCLLGVRSLGEGSKRWFGVHPVGDVTHEEIPMPAK
jgi:hypothetical protein